MKFFAVLFSVLALAQTSAAVTYVRLNQGLFSKDRVVSFHKAGPGIPFRSATSSQQACTFVGFASAPEGSFQAGKVLLVTKIDFVPSYEHIPPYSYKTIYRFQGGRVQCVDFGNFPNTAYANRLMRGYVTIFTSKEI